MPEIHIEIKGDRELLEALEAGNRTLAKELEGGMLRAVEYGRTFLARYPPPPAPGLWARLTTPAQKAAYFAGLRAGTIKPGRQGTLGKKWTTKVKTGEPLTGIIGTNVPYAQYVQDRDRQAKFHRGRWQTVQELAEAPHVGNITQTIVDAVERWVRNLGS